MIARRRVGEGNFGVLERLCKLDSPFHKSLLLSLRSLSARLENQAVLGAGGAKNGRIRAFAGSSKNHAGRRAQRGRETTNREVDIDPFCFLCAASEDRREDGLSQQARRTTCVFLGRGQEDRFFSGWLGPFSSQEGGGRSPVRGAVAQRRRPGDREAMGEETRVGMFVQMYISCRAANSKGQPVAAQYLQSNMGRYPLVELGGASRLERLGKRIAVKR